MRPALAAVCLAWAFMTFRTYVVKGDFAYHGDSDRYSTAAERLVDAWNHGGEFDAPKKDLGFLSLFLPFSPSGEKPTFIYAVAVIRLALQTVAPAYMKTSLLIVNGLSVLGIALCVFLLFKREGREDVGVLGAAIVFLSFDLFFHAREGYHTIMGVLLFLLGIYVNDSFRSWRRALWSGVLHGFSFFVSTHLMVPTVAWYASAFALSRSHRLMWRHLVFAGGGAAVVLTSQVAWLIQWRSGMPSVNALLMFFQEQDLARRYGGMVPRGSGFLWDYAFYQWGRLLSWAIAGLGAFAVFKTWKKPGMGATAILAGFVTYAVSVACGLPSIGRLYTPVLILFTIGALQGLAAVKSRKVARALAGVLVVTSAARFWCHYYGLGAGPNLGPTDQEMASRFPGARIVDNNEIGPDRLKNEDFSNEVIRVFPTRKFAHSALMDCQLEVALSEMMKKGLAPAAVVPDRWSPQYVYLNEFGYFGFQRRKWAKVFPEFTHLNELRPGSVYYFSGREVMGFFKRFPELRTVGCPQKEIYRSPKMPERFY